MEPIKITVIFQILGNPQSKTIRLKGIIIMIIVVVVVGQGLTTTIILTGPPGLGARKCTSSAQMFLVLNLF